ncbi:hypothetical protein [Nocardiopsis synnemataformans]|uniref:hypothetical protein n=1 Tax=Nocardiopsis synnemataformans TaxID=61305 RepID=UPI003EB80F68
MSSFPVPTNHDHWWLATGAWRRLHAVPRQVFNPDDEDVVDALTEWPGPPGRSVCGQDRGWQLPGVFSRLGCPRCAHCCDRLGIARGNGTPMNEGPQQR